LAGLLIGRILQSIGAGCGITLARAIGARCLWRQRSGEIHCLSDHVLTRWEPSLRPVFAGFLIDQAGWRSVFYFVTAIGFLIALVAYLVVPETGKHAAPIGAFPDYRAFLALLRYPRFCALVVTPAAPRAPSWSWPVHRRP